MRLTQELVRESFSYDPMTGEVRRRKLVPNSRIGAVVGTKNSHGHLICRLHYKIYYVHRLIWLYQTGELPPDEVDHINGDGADNRWENLRLATRAQNRWNGRRVRANNTSGELGVHWFKQYGCWRVIITANGVSKFLGYFDSKNEAIEARKLAEREMFGEFARAV